MVPLGFCLRIYYNILNFRICTIWLSLIFLIVRIVNLMIVLFLMKRQPEVSSLPIPLVIRIKSFDIIILALLRLSCFGSFCIGVCLLIWMLRKEIFLFVICALYASYMILIIYFLIFVLFSLYGLDFEIFFLVLCTYLLLALLLFIKALVVLLFI